ncbi:hypothetical protein PROFUN_11845 [Planoprotostelium fungivorum]|uniref:non-specific serine/threonine protein kinase n=1 Tax=Planoprotostelium fungivorum TaxID=1890364 RepID=A0A2P6N9A9_9EUKA|nr:hypothetical protein PROFUN_11845 [Planoprotostelium fungivorum]
MSSWPSAPLHHMNQHEQDQDASNNVQGVEVGSRWIVCERIGAGTFGEIHRATDNTGGKDVAVKFESAKQRQPQLFSEYKVYKSNSKVKHPVTSMFFSLRLYLPFHIPRKRLPSISPRNALQGSDSISKVFYHGSLPRHTYMVMELQGPSLEDLFNRHRQRFSLKTVLLIADRILHTLMDFHDREYIHRDIKPDNFLIGSGGRKRQIYIIDLGLARRTKKHINYTEGHSLTGTARYASLRNHLGAQQSRRDDMESLGYMLVYFAKGSLPWQGAKPGKTQKSQYEHIAERKIGTPLSVLCQGLPDEFVQYLQYVKSLGFEDRPDYEKMIKLFQTAMEREGYKQEDQFDWEQDDEIFAVPNMIQQISPSDQRDAKYLRRREIRMSEPSLGEKVTKSYIKFSGFNPTGGKGKRAAWFELEDYQWGVGRAIYNEEVSAPTISEVSLTMQFGQSFADINFRALSKQKFEEVTIETIGELYDEVTERAVMSSVYISGLSSSYSNDQFSSSVSLNFAAVKFIANAVDNHVDTLVRRKKIAEEFNREEMIGHVGTPFSTLPVEHLHIILSLLPSKDLLNASSTCKRFFVAACDPRLLVMRQATADVHCFQEERNAYSEGMIRK